jgi:two-component system response regulator NreC
VSTSVHPAPLVRVGLIDDHAILRDGLRLLLGADPRLEVVGEAAGLEQARRRWASWRADVLVLDLALGDGSGLALLRELAAAGGQGAAPPPRVVVLTMVDDPGSVQEALQAGAVGYVLKGRGGERLLHAVLAAARGEAWLDEAVAAHVLRGLRGDAPERARLTPREAEVVGLVAAGWTSAEIGRELGLATKTVQNHRANILDKLGQRTTAGVVRWALAAGLSSDRPPPGRGR